MIPPPQLTFQPPPVYRPQLRAVSAAPPIPTPVVDPASGGGDATTGVAATARPRPAAAASFTKAAAPTVKKLIPAQHNPALKALVPASVRIQREKEVLPPSKRQRVLITAPLRQAPTGMAAATAQPAANDKYLSFLDDMRDLGAFE
jgi:hypothetical protein